MLAPYHGSYLAFAQTRDDGFLLDEDAVAILRKAAKRQLRER